MHFYKIYIKSKVSWLHLGNSLITFINDYQKVFAFIKYLMKILVVSLVQFSKNINWYYHICHNSIKYYNPYFLIYFQKQYGFGFKLVVLFIDTRCYFALEYQTVWKIHTQIYKKNKTRLNIQSFLHPILRYCDYNFSYS